MSTFGEMKRYVGFTQADSDRLAALWPDVQPHAAGIVDHFYACILAHPQAAAVLRDEAQVERLKRTLERWLEELMCGPHDEAYYERRQRIGRVHVRVGLPHRFMFTAMSVMRDDLCQVAADHCGPNYVPACHSIGRITSLDLAAMTGTYLEAREEHQIASVQELIVAHMPVSVLLTDENLAVTAATRSAERLLGVVPGEGVPFVRVLPPALVHEADLESLARRAMATGREITLVRVDAVVDSELRNFRVNLVPLDHPVARLLIHVEELTDTVATESRLQRSEALAQLGALSAAVAHELRNPLAGISAAVQVIRGSLKEGDRRAEVLGRVQGQISRLDEMVTDLLAFARPGHARMARVDLGQVVRQVADLAIADARDVQIEVTGEGTAWADANLVHQVVLNLVQNARQAVDARGEVLIRVSPGRVVVSDSGPGVPEEHRDDVFAPFFTTRTRGTGLGLAISQRAAHAMHASLRLLDAGPLPGATFALDLATNAADVT